MDRSPHILVVDDDRDIRSLLARFLGEHGATAVTVAETDAYVRSIAVENGLLTLGQALRMTEGPRVVFGPTESCFDAIEPYFQDVFDTLKHGWPLFGEPTVMARLEAFGSYLMDHPEPPWLGGSLGDWGWMAVFAEAPDAAAPGQLSQAAYLGAAAILPIMVETDLMLESEALKVAGSIVAGPTFAKLSANTINTVGIVELALACVCRHPVYRSRFSFHLIGNKEFSVEMPIGW